jgi:hypothetical protein
MGTLARCPRGPARPPSCSARESGGRFNKAAKAASYIEAALVEDVYNLSAGYADPQRSSIRNDILGYVQRVVMVEWPQQAEGQMVDQDSRNLNALNEMALGLHPSGQADSDLHLLLLQTMERLWDARQDRLLAAQPTIPDIVWFVLVAGGGMTVALACSWARRACGCSSGCWLCWRHQVRLS